MEWVDWQMEHNPRKSSRSYASTYRFAPSARKLLLPAIGTSFALSSRECFIELQIVYRTRQGVERKRGLGELDW
jgi:hypothetical protein